MSDDIERIWLTHENKSRNWPDVLAAIKRFIADGCTVVITPKREARNQCQDRLYHRWTGQYAKAKGMTQAEVEGAFKWDILRDLKLADEKEHARAVKEEVMVRGSVSLLLASGEFGESARELTIEAAYDVVRSRDIGVALFAQYLTEIQHAASLGSIILEGRQDEIDQAIGEQMEQAS